MKIIATLLLFITSTFVYPYSVFQPGDTLQVKRQPVMLGKVSKNIKMSPHWSPDGKYLAYTTSGYKGIWILNIKTGKAKQITKEESSGFNFEWSGDSKSILCKVTSYKGKNRFNAVKLFNISSGETKLVTGYRSEMTGLPHFADNDRKIFICDSNNLEVFSSGKTSSQKASQNPSIFFLKGDQVASGNIKTKEVSVFEPVKDIKCLYLSTSPDKSKIAFESVGGKISVINTDGTGLVDLGKGFHPQWSPDSKSIVYMITKDDGQTYTASDIYTIKTDGNGKQNLTNTENKLEMNPSWAPDGSKIAFEDMKDGEIYVLEVNK